MIELWDMQDNVKVVVSEQLGNNILRFNNYNNGGRYIPIKEFSRHFDPVEEPESPQVEAIKEEQIDSATQLTNGGTVTLNTEKNTVSKPEPKPKATRTTKPKTNQKSK